jgi:hypothetical protein
VQLPSTDDAWNSPSMNGRLWSGTVSANSVTDAANTPPTPSPVRNRYRWKSQVAVDRALRPVKIA